MKKLMLIVTAAALAMGALTGCSQPAQPVATEVDEYIGVCMDKETQKRVDDSNCDLDTNATQYSPYFYPYGAIIPALGYGLIGGYSTIYAPYRMGFGSTGGSSSNYQPKKPLAYPKGYVAPPNAVFKKASPNATPPKTAAEAAAKYSAPKSSTSPKSNTSPKSGSSTTPKKKSNPYSYKGKTSTRK